MSKATAFCKPLADGCCCQLSEPACISCTGLVGSCYLESGLLSKHVLHGETMMAVYKAMEHIKQYHICGFDLSSTLWYLKATKRQDVTLFNHIHPKT